MNILMTGGSGFIGSNVAGHLLAEGHRVTNLTRRKHQTERLDQAVSLLTWDEFTARRTPWSASNSFDAVINLAGESIAQKRWTAAQKSKILRSRQETTRRLLETLTESGHPRLKLLVSASAIGYYPYDSEKTLDESASAGGGFLSQVCLAWEKVATEFVGADRTLILRLGTVLGPGGGMLAKVIPLYRLGLGGLMGPPNKWMSWIHNDDVAKIISLALTDHAFSGIINGVTERPIQVREVEEAMAKAGLKRDAFINMPPWFFTLVLGEMAQLLLESQRIESSVLRRLGYRYLYPSLESAFNSKIFYE